LSHSTSLIDQPVRRRSRTRKGLLALAASGLVLALGAAPASADPVDGSAFGIAADVLVTGPGGLAIDASIPPTPAVACPPDDAEEVVGVDVPTVLSAGALTVECTTTDNVLSAKASVADLNLLDQLTAELVTAECTANGGVMGSSSLVNAELAGVPLDVAPGPNTVIEIAGLGTVTLNRQTVTKDAEGNDTITVEAIVVELDATVPVSVLPPELGGLLPPDLQDLVSVAGELVVSSVTCTAAPDAVPPSSGPTPTSAPGGGGTGTTAPPPPAGELPRTGGGSSTGTIAGLGVALVAAGALSLAASRRARGSHTA